MKLKPQKSINLHVHVFLSSHHKRKNSNLRTPNVKLIDLDKSIDNAETFCWIISSSPAISERKPQNATTNPCSSSIVFSQYSRRSKTRVRQGFLTIFFYSFVTLHYTRSRFDNAILLPRVPRGLKIVYLFGLCVPYPSLLYMKVLKYLQLVREKEREI